MQKQGTFPSSGARVSADSPGSGPVFMVAQHPTLRSPPKRPHLFRVARSDRGLSLGAQLSPEATKRSRNGKGHGQGAGQSPGDGRTVTDPASSTLGPGHPRGCAGRGARCGGRACSLMVMMTLRPSAQPLSCDRSSPPSGSPRISLNAAQST